MTLQRYLNSRDESQSAFAARAAVAQSQVSRICAGLDVGGKTWVKITAASEGKVRPEDHWPAHRRRSA